MPGTRIPAVLRLCRPGDAHLQDSPGWVMLVLPQSKAGKDAELCILRLGALNITWRMPTLVRAVPAPAVR